MSMTQKTLSRMSKWKLGIGLLIGFLSVCGTSDLTHKPQKLCVNYLCVACLSLSLAQIAPRVWMSQTHTSR